MSITAHETIVFSEEQDPDQALILFYRNNSIDPSDTPLDDLQVHTFNNLQSWEQLQRDAEAFRKEGRLPNTLALVRTPKEVGKARMQSLWYSNEATDRSTFNQHITRSDGNWEELAVEVKDFLNDFIPPHKLVSITLYEESHPSTSGVVSALVTHTAG